MDDRVFDELLTENLDGLPPEEVPTEQVTPWQSIMGCLLWGLALTMCTLELWGLQYILPTIGMVLLLLFYRGMRRENRWFFTGWILSIALLVLQAVTLCLNASWWGTAISGWLTQGKTVLLYLVQLTRSFCLWRGLLELQRKAGQLQPRAGSAFAVMVVHALMLAASFVGGVTLNGVLGWMALAAAVALYIVVLRCLVGLRQTLMESGYVIEPAPVKAPNWLVGTGCIAICLVAVLTSLTWFTRYPMEYTPVEHTEQSGLEEIRGELLALDFPEEVLDVLSGEDLMRLKGAIRVETQDRVWVVGRGFSADYDYSDYIELEAEGGSPQQLMYGIVVEVPSETEDATRREVVHYFRWLEEPIWRGTESIRLETTWYEQTGSLEGSVDEILDVSGRVLCDRAGVTYGADYYEILEDYVQNSFWGFRFHSMALGYSLPRTGTNLRGYVIFAMEREAGTEGVLWTLASYGHQTAPWSYPFESAAAKSLRLGRDGGSYGTLRLTFAEASME